MAPNVTTTTLTLEGATSLPPLQLTSSKAAAKSHAPVEDKQQQYEWKIVWRNVIAFIYLHVAGLYGAYLMFTAAKIQTVMWVLFVGWAAGMGITAGAHRLWAHRAYKAKWPLRLLLAAFNNIAFQNHIYEWVRDHRVHHKFTDSDADPHNAKRGFFFSHMGWLMVRKHPEVKARGRQVDLSDLEADPIVVWQRRTYPVLMPLMCFVFPTWVPVRFWGEDLWVAWHVAAIFRYALSLNFTWLVNSAAHIWGLKPYDRTISPVESVSVAVLAFGEGWHNYHHVFPWDYKAAELGNYRLNFTTAFIDLMARLGLAYDLKTVPEELILRRVARKGDGTHPKAGSLHHSQQPAIWGWGDVDLDEEDASAAVRSKRL